MPIFFSPSSSSHKDATDSYTFAIGEDVAVVESVPALTRALAERPTEMLVVVGADVDLGVALELASDQRSARPQLGVVLMRRRVDIAVLGQALRAGVREVVSADDLNALAEACRRSEEVSRRVRGQSGDRGAGKVVTVFSAKGGCGKTTVSTNLAVALADNGRRRVCLIDLDLAFGDVGISLQLFPDRTVADAVGMQEHMDETGVRSLLTRHSSGVDVILAPLEPSDAEKIPGRVVAELLATARRMFDYVVVDTPPALNEHVLAAFDAADSCVLLATLDIPAVKNLRLTLDMLDVLGYQSDSLHVVLNRSDAKVGLSATDVENSLRRPISVKIPSSRSVPIAANRGVPLVADEPGHAVSAAIRRLAEERIVGAQERAGTTTETTVKPVRARRGLPLLRRGGQPA
jgi:pilus assembly protein CpaE